MARPKGSISKPREFEVVNGSEAQQAKALPAWTPGRKPSAMAKALEDGEVVWLAGLTPAQANALGAPLRLRRTGWRTHVRPAQRGDIEGVYLWAEKAGASRERVVTA